MSIRTVTFQWDDSLGECEDCGNPAAYAAPDCYGRGKGGRKLCSVCASSEAASGERIVYLFPDDVTEDPLPEGFWLPLDKARALMAALRYDMDNNADEYDDDVVAAFDYIEKAVTTP